MAQVCFIPSMHDVSSELSFLFYALICGAKNAKKFVLKFFPVRPQKTQFAHFGRTMKIHGWKIVIDTRMVASKWMAKWWSIAMAQQVEWLHFKVNSMRRPEYIRIYWSHHILGYLSFIFVAFGFQFSFGKGMPVDTCAQLIHVFPYISKLI